MYVRVLQALCCISGDCSPLSVLFQVELGEAARHLRDDAGDLHVDHGGDGGHGERRGRLQLLLS